MIFEVSPTHIEALTDTDLRTLVGYLAEREVVKAGHSASSVTYGGHQNAKDGGVDVRIALESGAISGFVPRLACAFQAKAESFAPADITKEMRPGGKLRESIRGLGEGNGAYIIVSSKSSVSDLGLEMRRKAMQDALADESSTRGLLVDFYDPQRLASWVNQHPGIIPWVRSHVGQAISGWRPFQDWSSSPSAEDSPYVLDDGIRLLATNQSGEGFNAHEGINRLRSILSAPNGVVRLVGLSGVGKTRLVQALFDERIGSLPLSRHLAVYTDIGDNPDPVPGELLSALQSCGQRCILIVDNCGAELHSKLTARLSAASSISLITIEYDISDDEPENTEVFKLEPGSNEVIEKILKSRFTDLTAPEIRTIADFSEGNFKIALALANTSKGGHSLANLKDKELFNRLFRQKNEDNPSLLRTAKICSLVYSFDVETMDGEEAEMPLLAELADQSISEFNGYVAELRRRGLVQARSKWRALLPHALAHRLAKHALEDIPTLHLKVFIGAAPARLLKSFSRRLGCLHDSIPAQTIVSEWLSEEGILSAVGQLSPLGMVILDNVAPVNPEAVLESIQHAAEDQVSFFEANPNEAGLVRLLRSIAYEASLFDHATRLIARFARSKTKSNNMGDAVNVFRSLFHIHLSGTHASANTRAILIRDLAEAGAEPDEVLVLTALDAMLECGHFSSSYGFEFGVRKRDYGFRPTTRDEQWDWYAEAFRLACDLALNASLRTRVRTMVASQFRYLATRARLADLIAVAEDFASDGGWPEGWAGVRGALREARESNHEESVKKLTKLEAMLAPDSLAHRIASYVLPRQWSTLDLADVDVDDERNYEQAHNKIDEVCQEIGAELAYDLVALAAHLPEMLESTWGRAFTVAQTIGRTTSDPDRAWKTIERCVFADHREYTINSFPSGFLIGLSERDANWANEILDKAAASAKWHPFLAHMQSCVGLDTAGVKRLIATIPLSSLPTWTLRSLGAGRSTDHLSDADFNALLLAIAAKADGLDVAIDILHMRCFSLISDKKPITNVERDLASELLASVTFERKNIRDPHMLALIVKHCLDSPKDHELARGLCKRLLRAIGDYKVSPWDYGELVSELAGRFPRVVLDEIVEPEGAQSESRRTLFEDFREHRSCPLGKIDDNELLRWAHEKANIRFSALAASIVGWHGLKTEQNPNVAPGENVAASLKWTPAAWRLIHEAPDPIPVLAVFYEGIRPSSWSGSRADILASREPLLETLAADPDQRIADWAKKALPSFREETEYERRSEAKQERARGERFDW
jgi:hypothetical protein